MAINTKPLEQDSVKETVVPKLPEAFIKTIQDEANSAAKKATEDAFKYAQVLSTELLATVTDKINEACKAIEGKPVLHIQIDNAPIKELKDGAVPYLDRMIANAKIGENTMLVGPAGAGKTFACEQLAEVLGMPFSYINLTAGASETWLFGRQTPTGFVEGPFAKAYREGGVFLADEMDAADPNLLLALNTAIAGNKMNNPINGQLYDRHKNFVFVGAANTFGKGASTTYTGRNRLDGASLDRFTVIEVGYNVAVESKLCPDKQLLKTMHELRKLIIETNSTEIVSTRKIKSCYLQVHAGVPVKDVLQSVVCSWPKDLQKKAWDIINKVLKERVGHEEVVKETPAKGGNDNSGDAKKDDWF